MNELERLLQGSESSLPETGLIISINPKLSDASLKKLMELMKSIIELEKLEKKEEDCWEEDLPYWFVSQTKNISDEDLLSNEELWDFESWVDAMKHRAWRWWKCKTMNDSTKIYLETVAYPYIIDPFFYMLYTVGVSFDNTSIKEIYPGSRNLTVV